MCSCGVSIIYLASQQPLDKAAEEELIKRAKELGVEQDRVQESPVRALIEGAVLGGNNILIELL